MDITQLITARVFAYNELSGKGTASFYSEVDGEHTLSVIEINIDDYCVLEIEDGSVRWQPRGADVTPDLHFTEIVCHQVANGRASLWTEAERYRRVSLGTRSTMFAGAE